MVRETCCTVSSSGSEDKEADRFFTSKTFQTNSYRRNSYILQISVVTSQTFHNENNYWEKMKGVSSVLEKIISRKIVSQTISVTNTNWDIILLFVPRTLKPYMPKKIKIILWFKVLLFV